MMYPTYFTLSLLTTSYPLIVIVTFFFPLLMARSSFFPGSVLRPLALDRSTMSLAIRSSSGCRASFFCLRTSTTWMSSAKILTVLLHFLPISEIRMANRIGESGDSCGSLAQSFGDPQLSHEVHHWLYSCRREGVLHIHRSDRLR